MTADPRIVYGAGCAWWDSIANVGTKPSGLNFETARAAFEAGES